MSLGFWQIVVIAILAVLLFGRGRISDLMGDVAKGIKSFKKGLSDEEENRSPQQTYVQQDIKNIEHHKEHSTLKNTPNETQSDKIYKSFD
jgi:sec-independent protein translocase protein TatA